MNYKELLSNILKPYSAILFLNNHYVGFIVLLTTFLNPSVALSGLVALLCTILFSKLINLGNEFLSAGFYLYNSLLVGMGIGYVFSPSLLSFILIGVGAAFTFLLSFMINRLFIVYKIPPLSLPFAIVIMFFYLATMKYSYLYSDLVNHGAIYDIELPLLVSSFLKSLGTIFFLPHNLAGLVFIALILYFSRIMFLLALLGFYFGIYFHSCFLDSFEQALHDPYAFNYIIVSMALGGVFLIPSLKNILLSIIAVAISVVLVDAMSILFNYYAIPVFTIPFNITVIAFIFILSTTFYKEFNYAIQETPEASLRNYLNNFFRFSISKIKISLPFSEEWLVYQAFDDEWTHQGEYQYAYDFVKLKDGKSYQNEGYYLTDYYAFGQSILAPVSGFVIDARDNFVDNIIGEVDRINNWGNYIIIKSDLGFFVEISHLMQYSLSVKVGDYITINTPIAKCGNSGYSPEPHIHIQVQKSGLLNSFTQEFIFSEYYQGNHLLFNSLPKKGEEVSSIIINQNIKSRLNFILDETFKYKVIKDNHTIDKEIFTVKMNPKGEFYFQDKRANQLFFNLNQTEFYFYNYVGGESYLKELFILAPRFPFVHKNDIYFEDYLPINLVKNRYQTILIELLSIINKNLYKVRRRYRYIDNHILSTRGKIALSQKNKGFELIESEHFTLQRIYDENE